LTGALALLRVLILILILVLVLLLLECLDLAFDQVAIVLAVRVLRLQLQRRLIGLHGLRPLLNGFLRR
jgi:hypothetical protein